MGALSCLVFPSLHFVRVQRSGRFRVFTFSLRNFLRVFATPILRDASQAQDRSLLRKPPFLHRSGCYLVNRNLVSHILMFNPILGKIMTSASYIFWSPTLAIQLRVHSTASNPRSHMQLAKNIIPSIRPSLSQRNPISHCLAIRFTGIGLPVP